MSEVGGTLEQKPKMELTGDERFVVKKTMGNPISGKPFEPGQVISAKQINPEGKAPKIEEIDRLVGLDAITLALDHEKEQDYVDLNKRLAPGKSLTESNTELQNKVAKLQARCEQLAAENEDLKVQKSAKYDPHKDQLVEDLRQADREMITQLQQKLTKSEELNDGLNKKLQQKK